MCALGSGARFAAGCPASAFGPASREGRLSISPLSFWRFDALPPALPIRRARFIALRPPFANQNPPSG